MRERKVTALYCDHCNKRGFQRPRMEKHELHCTKNPNRECGMCKWMRKNNDVDFHGKSVAELHQVVCEGGEEALLRLREASNNCPACMLAAVRLLYSSNESARLVGGDSRFLDVSNSVDFDWKAERDRWNKLSAEIMNEQQQDAGGYY